MKYVPPVGGADNDPYVDGNPSTGVEGSPVPAAAIEDPMREIVAVIEAAGLTQDPEDLTQLSAGITALISGYAPGPGAVIFVAKGTAPSGYLKANGAAVSRTAYAALFAAIGTTFGVGDGATTFNLPDFRGEFLRGLDDGRGIDSGRTIGTSQDGTWVRTVAQEWSGSDAPNGTFSIGIGYAQADATINTSGVGGTVPTGAKAPSSDEYSAATTDNAIQGSAYVETVAVNNWIKMRPRNIALLACIKY